MVRAMYRTQQWLWTNSPSAIAGAIASFFPALDQAILARALSRYREQGVWGSDPILPEDGFDRLHRSLVSGRFIRLPVGYQACVDNRLAQQVVGKGDSQ
jgi:NitT/TauT family transport system substrate-binding protein